MALSPEDAAIRAQLLDAYVDAGDFARARECATTADQFRSLALAFEAKGHETESLAALSDAARLDPTMRNCAPRSRARSSPAAT